MIRLIGEKDGGMNLRSERKGGCRGKGRVNERVEGKWWGFLGGKKSSFESKKATFGKGGK